MVRPLVVTEDLKSQGWGPDRTQHSLQNYVSLTTALAAAGADQVELIVDRIEAIPADITVPANVRLRFWADGRFQIAPAATLTIYSPEHILADPRQRVFEGVTHLVLATGAVAFTQVGTVHPAWWGALADGTTDDTPALAAAITASESYGTVELVAGTYLFSQLLFPNPVTLRGAPTVRNRWNSDGAGTTLLADGTEDPAILVAGTADSIVTEADYNFAEGIRLKNFLLKPDAGDGRGIVIDGSTADDEDRGPARDIEFENVHLSDFTDHNMEIIGNVFDFRWKAGSSRRYATTGVIATTEDSYGSNTPGQLHLYDCYLYGNSVGPEWALWGAFLTYGGAIAYGNGFYMASGACLFGTHVEGSVEDAGIGLQIVGQYQKVLTNTISSFATGIVIGDGSADVTRRYLSQVTINGCTTGIQITDGGERSGTAHISFATCTLDIEDLRSSGDGIEGSLEWSNKQNAEAPPAAGNHLRGQHILNCEAAAGTAVGWRCQATGAPGIWVPLGTHPGGVNENADYDVLTADTGKRFTNSGAGGVTTYSLPAGVIGMRYHFTRLSTANAIRVDPDAAEIIKPGAAGKYVSLDTVGASITIECMAAGQWFIVAETGTVSHEG